MITFREAAKDPDTWELRGKIHQRRAPPQWEDSWQEKEMDMARPLWTYEGGSFMCGEIKVYGL